MRPTLESRIPDNNDGIKATADEPKIVRFRAWLLEQAASDAAATE